MAIKGFMNSIKKGVSRASNKIDKTVEIKKIQYRISKKEEELDNIYCDLGKKIIDSHSDNTDCSAAVAAAFEKAQGIKETIAGYEEEIRLLKGIAHCVNCGSDIDLKTAYCSKCGAKNENYIEEKDEQESSDESVSDVSSEDALSDSDDHTEEA